MAKARWKKQEQQAGTRFEIGYRKKRSPSPVMLPLVGQGQENDHRE